MLVTYSTSHTGVVYPYFMCAGRHRKRNEKNGCQLKSFLIADAEYQMEKIYDCISFTPEERVLIETHLKDYISQEQEKYKTEVDRLRRQKVKIERKQEKLLETYYNDAIPLQLMKKQQQALSKELAAVESEIAMHTATFEEIIAELTEIMDTFENCGETYREATGKLKRLMNQAIFDQVLVTKEGQLEPQPNSLCEGIFKAKHYITKSTPTEVDADSIRKLFKSGSKFFEQGLNNDCLVEHTGFEPVTSTMRM